MKMRAVLAGRRRMLLPWLSLTTILLSLAVVTHETQAASMGEVQPANQAPAVAVAAAAAVAVATPSPPPPPPGQTAAEIGGAEAASATGQAPNPSSIGSGEQATNGQQQGGETQVASQLAPTKLPKINIFISRQEAKKLLGIASRIDYVDRGNINSYPFGFTIPIGYNQSEMIFTWQNLGPTNVNYSISLELGNRDALLMPKINISRSGLIPRQEQVFKITLPCSGKVTDEVDVQVFIEVQGQVAPEEASGLAGGDSNNVTTAQVRHKLAIKRKKICTQHPLQVARPTTPIVAVAPPLPPQQPASMPMLPPPPPPQPQPQPPILLATTGRPAASAAELPTHHQHQHHQHRPAFKLADEAPTANEPLQQRAFAKPAAPSAPEPPATLKGFHEPARHFEYPHWPPPPPPPAASAERHPSPGELVVTAAPPPAHQQVQVGGSSPLVLSLVALSLLVSAALVVVAILGSSSAASSSSLGQSAHMHARSPLDKLGSLSGCLLLARFVRAQTAPAGHSASARRPQAKCKPPSAAAALGSLRLPKSSHPSSLSGLSAASGKQVPAHYFKTAACPGYYQSQQQQQYQYQQPPTADLLGTGYQCQQQQQQQQHHYPPIYHIATGASNPSQTTRLIWSQGSGTSPDGYTLDGAYMPLSNGPARSDSGSVYQTIY